MTWFHKVLTLVSEHAFHADDKLLSGVQNGLRKSRLKGDGTVAAFLRHSLFDVLGKRESAFVPGAQRHSYLNYFEPSTKFQEPAVLTTLNPFTVSSGYVSVVGEVEYNDATWSLVESELGRLDTFLTKSPPKRWVLDLSKFHGGAEGPVTYLLSPFFGSDTLGYYVGKNWVNKVQLKHRTEGRRTSSVCVNSTVKVVVLVSEQTTSAGEFVAAFLKYSRLRTEVVSVDGVGRTNGRLSVTYSEEVGGKAAPFFVTAYYVPSVQGDLARVAQVKWNKLTKTAEGLNEQGKTVLKVPRPLPFVTSDRNV